MLLEAPNRSMYFGARSIGSIAGTSSDDLSEAATFVLHYGLKFATQRGVPFLPEYMKIMLWFSNVHYCGRTNGS